MLTIFPPVSTGTEINCLAYNFNPSFLFIFKDRTSFFTCLDYQNVLVDYLMRKHLIYLHYFDHLLSPFKRVLALFVMGTSFVIPSVHN